MIVVICHSCICHSKGKEGGGNLKAVRCYSTVFMVQPRTILKLVSGTVECWVLKRISTQALCLNDQASNNFIHLRDNCTVTASVLEENL